MHDEHPRQYHDMGGQEAGPVDLHEHEIELWEKRIEAMVRLLSLRENRLITVDELRRGIEQLPPEDYDNLTYYERWIRSLVDILVEKEVLDREELEAKVAEIQARDGAEEA